LIIISICASIPIAPFGNAVSDMRETLVGLFTEVAIVEHLTRTRVERQFPEGIETAHFGILNYFIRNHPGPDTIGGIAWAFQEDEDRVAGQVEALASLGYVSLVQGLKQSDTMVSVTDAGRAAQERQLDQIGPDFEQLVGEIPLEELQITHRVLHEIRLVMDNLPDR
jgi:DNA-binding MarR family transcriptional regulator